MSRREKPLSPAWLHIVLALLDGERHSCALMGGVAKINDGVVRMGPGIPCGTLNGRRERAVLRRVRVIIAQELQLPDGAPVCGMWRKPAPVGG